MYNHGLISGSLRQPLAATSLLPFFCSLHQTCVLPTIPENHLIRRRCCFFIVIYSFTIVLNIFFKLWDHCNWLTAVVASLPKKTFIVLCFSIHYYPFLFFFSLYHVIGEANKIKIKLNKKIHVH